MSSSNRPNSLNRIARPGTCHAVQCLGLRLALVAAGLLSCTQALALPGDPVQWFVEEDISHDSNLFRVSKNANPSSDTRMNTTAGVLLDVPVSLQRFQGEVSFSQNNFSNNDALDYTGRNLRAAWLWQVGDPLSGELGYTDTRRLSAFTDAGINADLLTVRRTYGSAAWMITPKWRLQAGLAKQEFEHDVRQTQDLEVDSLNMALSYVSRAENSIGLALRQDDVAYHQTNSGNDYQHRSIGLQIDWSITDKSRVNGSIGLAERDFDSAALKDYRGAVYRLAYDYQATDKLSLTTVALRDFAPSEDVDSRSIRIDSLALQPRFRLTEKITLGANAEYAQRDYVASVSGRQDKVRSIAGYLTYQPLLSLQIGLRLQHEKRSSNIVNNDYTANVAGINVHFSF